jgi:endonuclease/exonuclease/phosphatase family metal-dependent hydrolase
MRVLSWNLYHGRDFPAEPPGERVDVNRPLLDEFATVLDGLDWDVALLQEAPPRWFRELQRRTRSTGARVLTSRNWWPWLQRKLANWNPDLIKSSEGGSNQLLVRAPDGIAEHRTVTLARLPERRRMQWARLDSGVCVVNLHASAGRPWKATAEVIRAAALGVDWSGSDPLVLGGDLNLRPATTPGPFAELRERFGLGEPTAPNAIDHLLVRDLGVAERPRQLTPGERELPDVDGRLIRLSDHAPVVAEFVR